MYRASQARTLILAVAAALLASTAYGFSTGGRGDARSGASRIVTDEVGRAVTVPAEATRIVSLAPDLTEAIYTLRLEDRLAGDTDYCDTPAAAKTKPHVGAPLNPSLEAIVALHPDLVLATTSINRRETVDALARLGIAVYTTDPHTVRGMLDSIVKVAALAGAETAGAELAGHLRMRLDALQMRLVDRPLIHVLFVVWESPLITIGQNTFIADALRWAGAESVIVSKQNWPAIGLEEVVRLQPDYIVFSNHTGSTAVEMQELRSSPGWKGLSAIEAGHIVLLRDESALRPSPGLIDVIEQLAHELHPEVFASRSGTRELHTGVQMIHVAVSAGPFTECTQCAR